MRLVFYLLAFSSISPHQDPTATLTVTTRAPPWMVRQPCEKPMRVASSRGPSHCTGVVRAGQHRFPEANFFVFGFKTLELYSGYFSFFFSHKTAIYEEQGGFDWSNCSKESIDRLDSGGGGAGRVSQYCTDFPLRVSAGPFCVPLNHGTVCCLSLSIGSTIMNCRALPSTLEFF